MALLILLINNKFLKQIIIFIPFNKINKVEIRKIHFNKSSIQRSGSNGSSGDG